MNLNESSNQQVLQSENKIAKQTTSNILENVSMFRKKNEDYRNLNQESSIEQSANQEDNYFDNKKQMNNKIQRFFHNYSQERPKSMVNYLRSKKNQQSTLQMSRIGISSSQSTREIRTVSASTKNAISQKSSLQQKGNINKQLQQSEIDAKTILNTQKIKNQMKKMNSQTIKYQSEIENLQQNRLNEKDVQLLNVINKGPMHYIMNKGNILDSFQQIAKKSNSTIPPNQQQPESILQIENIEVDSDNNNMNVINEVYKNNQIAKNENSRKSFLPDAARVKSKNNIRKDLIMLNNNEEDEESEVTDVILKNIRMNRSQSNQEFRTHKVNIQQMKPQVDNNLLIQKKINDQIDQFMNINLLLKSEQNKSKKSKKQKNKQNLNSEWKVSNNNDNQNATNSNIQQKGMAINKQQIVNNYVGENNSQQDNQYMIKQIIETQSDDNNNTSNNNNQEQQFEQQQMDDKESENNSSQTEHREEEEEIPLDFFQMNPKFQIQNGVIKRQTSKSELKKNLQNQQQQQDILNKQNVKFTLKYNQYLQKLQEKRQDEIKIMSIAQMRQAPIHSLLQQGSFQFVKQKIYKNFDHLQKLKQNEKIDQLKEQRDFLEQQLKQKQQNIFLEGNNLNIVKEDRITLQNKSKKALEKYQNQNQMGNSQNKSQYQQLNNSGLHRINSGQSSKHVGLNYNKVEQQQQQIQQQNQFQNQNNINGFNLEFIQNQQQFSDYKLQQNNILVTDYLENQAFQVFKNQNNNNQYHGDQSSRK